ncbi:LysR family transcriptional regulator [Roseomonas sp. GC11]|uniref:LysR family transcriptional regulator n=1 Tax=Roseomonas sp. GC11 TaxID=2950546 RepID=UPI00210E58FF|nr:LysR family transcriptional regulator [Roseomonas sp. GC11]MCQ4159880.1 LysR family transcriptional regulator [Roseomonas sp. GC11]
MNWNNPRGIDLNLLRVFMAIWDLRSLTAAGDRLGLTQPAVSHALRRLRETFHDPLFVRAGHAMVPTEAAARLREPLDQAFALLHRAVQEHRSFDPARSDRIFRIAMTDASEYFLLPKLLPALKREAPSVRLEITPLSVETVAAAMRSGEVDLAFGYVPGPEEGIDSGAIFSDAFVCMVRAGHPLPDRPVTAEDLSGLQYVYATVNAAGHQVIERVLQALGVRREFILRIAHFTVAPEVVRSTDLAVIFPRSIAERFNSHGDFRLHPLPFTLPPIEVGVHTHASFQGDAGIQWLRRRILALHADFGARPV